MIELPFPHKVLWPNGRPGHWAQLHRERRKHRQWAHDATLAAVGRKFMTGERVRWSATFYPKTSHAIDDDNARASLKSYQDGIASALGVNDCRFDAPRIHFAEPSKPGKVVIVIQPEGE